MIFNKKVNQNYDVLEFSHKKHDGKS